MCTLMLVWSEHWVFSLFLQCYGVFLFLNVVFLLVGFSFFLFICRRCFVCIYSFITPVSCSVYFGCAGSPGVFLAGRVIFSFRVGLRCVECRSGTIYLSASLGWVAGLYRFFFSWALLWWVRYDWSSGEGVVIFSLPSSVCCQLCRLAVVCGRAPFFL